MTLALITISILLFAIWGALLKLTDHIGALRRIAEQRAHLNTTDTYQI